MTKRGSKPGEKRGPGRKGIPNKATKEAKLALEDLAKGHAEAALQALVSVATGGEFEAARVSAAVAILDRGYGKPRQAVEHAGPDGGALQIQIVRFGGTDPDSQ